jgi:LuxR family transcriptional regulator, maltose regulon positive regulatory protein
MVPRRALITRLASAERVTEVLAPAGTGKTALLRSWVAEADLAERAAWVSVPPDERDAQRFWLSVLDALRDTTAGPKLLRPLKAAPGLDCWGVVERLLKDLASLEDRIWLVVDDLHELRSAEALRQLQLLVLRAPPELRFMLATRRDLRLGLHRLRVEGELTEIRATDLAFTLEETRALFDAAGVQLSGSALALLHARAEGWAAGLRLAALSLAGHPDPERFAAEFSGSERTVAEYLLAEVLDPQPEPVRRLLLRTSILERVNGKLADLLTGEPGGERILLDLEQAGAFVVSLDAGRSWFGYHPLLADLLQLQLRRSAPCEVPALHAAAAGWFAEHGYPVEAVGHAQAAGNWDLAARLLSDHWLDLVLGGQGSTAQQLLTTFPASVVAAGGELTALMAADQLARGSSGEAERHLEQARRRLVSLPADRRGRFQVMLGILGLWLARKRGDLPSVRQEAQRLLASAEELDPAHFFPRGDRPPGPPAQLSDDLRAVALLSLGSDELRATRLQDARRHLEQGITLARQAERPYLEIEGLAHSAVIARLLSPRLAVERSIQAIELARKHGWNEEPVTAPAYATLGLMKVWQGHLEEAGPLLDHAERAVGSELQPMAAMTVHTARGTFELARGREHEALAAFRAATRLAELLVTQSEMTTWGRAGLLHALLRLGETEQVEAALAGLDGQQSETDEMRTVLAALRLAQDDPQGAADALAPVLDGSITVLNRRRGLVHLLLEAIARDALGQTVAAGRALERALDIAEAEGALLPFLLYRAPTLLERHRRNHTAHPVLLSQILGLLAPTARPTSPPGNHGGRAGGLGLDTPLTDCEARVLRYLPTNLTAREIASRLHLSVHTVTTHMRHVYIKLGVHRRQEAVDRARALGLLTLIASRLRCGRTAAQAERGSSRQEPPDPYADPGGHRADCDADEGVRQAENGLLPRVLGADGGHDHDHRCGDPRRDRVAGPAQQHDARALAPTSTASAQAWKGRKVR